MISVIFPARGRPAEIQASINSLYATAANLYDVEILVRFDDDDETVPRSFVRDARHAMRDLERVIIGPRHGYANVHLYYNELAAQAKGDHILIWNDDTVCKTSHWDQLLSSGPPFAMQFLRRDSAKTSDFTFWSIGRPLYEALGCISPQPAPDLFASHVALHSGTCVVRDDIVFHHECLPAVDRPRTEYNPHAPERREERRAAMERVLHRPAWGTRYNGFVVDSEHPRTGIPYEYRVDGQQRLAMTYTVRR